MEEEDVVIEKYDVVIIGGGPGGLTAGIYAARSNLKTVFIEKDAPGGKMVTTAKIENWSGDISIDGPNLSIRMFEHAKAYGAKYKYGKVVKVDSYNDKKITSLEDGSKIESKAIVIASGMVEKIPTWIKNVEKLENKGVSYCAICDGPLFTGKDVAVIGGGNSAIEEATYLSSIANKVYLIVKYGIDADKKSFDELKEKKNVEIYLDSEVLELHGENKLEKATVNFNGNKKEITISAFFPYIGQKPISNFISHLNITDDVGFIKTDENMETKAKNIFAIGDIRVKKIRQISTAVADGTIASKVIANKIG